MRRVKATQALSRVPLYVDLDACPLIVRGSVTEQDANGKPKRTVDCTVLYFSAHNQTGAGLVEYVDETPEELFALPVIGEPVINIEKPKRTRSKRAA